MTFDQSLAFTVIAAMMALFIWGRLRYDIVGCLALLASVATGLVELALQRISRYVRSVPAQLFVLVATVTVLSASSRTSARSPS